MRQTDNLLHDWLIRSRVYKRRPIRVRVYKDAAALKAAAIAYGVEGAERLVIQGLYMSGPMWWDNGGRRASDGALGHILLHVGQCGVGTVTHEFMHAMIDLIFHRGVFKQLFAERARDRKLPEKRSYWAGRTDEKICNYAGDMLSMFWKKWYQYHEHEKAANWRKSDGK